MLVPGTRIDDRYEVGELLGRGGMADVVRADDVVTGEAVAIKVLRLHDRRSILRFRTELEVLQLLDHPSVVRLRDSGCHDTLPYLVLDLVEGPTLATLLLDGPLGLEQAVATGAELASALVHAHRFGVVHRDVKPSNVLFADDLVHPLLADFGIALLADATRMTATGSCVGTAGYLAPEQLDGSSGPAADVYSLGLVLLESLTGLLCFPGTAAEAAFSRLHRSPAMPADLPSWLQHTLRAMTARQPEQRPRADAVAAAFEERSVDPLLESTAPLSITEPLDGKRPVASAPAPATVALDRDTVTLRERSESTRAHRSVLGGAIAAAVATIVAASAILALSADGEPRSAQPTSPVQATTSSLPQTETTVTTMVAAAVAPEPTPTAHQAPTSAELPADNRGNGHDRPKAPKPPKEPKNRSR